MLTWDKANYTGKILVVYNSAFTNSLTHSFNEYLKGYYMSSTKLGRGYRVHRNETFRTKLNITFSTAPGNESIFMPGTVLSTEWNTSLST